MPTVIFNVVFRKFEQTRPGERIMNLLLAPTLPQAAVDASGIRGVMNASTFLRSLILSVRRERISLVTGHDIAAWKSDLRQVRNLSIGTCVAEECAFWLDETDATVNPSEEILGAVRPALLQFEHGRLLLVSSPWAKSGPLWTAWSKRLERDKPLVARIATSMGNPVLTAERLAVERERDPERYEREINAEFLDVATALLPSDAVDACAARMRWETVPKAAVIYYAGIDAGFRSDAFAFALCHVDGAKVILDICRSWKPRPGRAVQFAPVMQEIIEVMQRFGATRAAADQVANEVIRQYLASGWQAKSNFWITRNYCPN